MSIELSVVIPAIPKDPFVKDVVASVKQQKNINLEIIVVFNPYLPPWGQKKVRIAHSPLGANCARNVGLKLAKSDLVFFLDSDCMLKFDNDLCSRVKLMNENKNWVGAGGIYTIPEASSLTTRAYNFIQNDWLTSNVQNSKHQAAFLIGGNMMLRKSLLNGLEFDENLQFGGTEKEFFCRLHKENSNLFLLPHWDVLHLSQINRQQLKSKARSQAQGSLYIAKKGVNYFPHKKSIFKEMPKQEVLSEVEIYHKEFERVMSGSISEYSFKNVISRIVDRIDLAIHNIKNA